MICRETKNCNTEIIEYNMSKYYNKVLILIQKTPNNYSTIIYFKSEFLQHHFYLQIDKPRYTVRVSENSNDRKKAVMEKTTIIECLFHEFRKRTWWMWMKISFDWKAKQNGKLKCLTKNATENYVGVESVSLVKYHHRKSKKKLCNTLPPSVKFG